MTEEDRRLIAEIERQAKEAGIDTAGMEQPRRYILAPGHIPVPADLIAYGMFCSDDANVRVGHSMVGDVMVSTVFIGMPLCMFETMVFPAGRLNGPCFRYATWDEAEEGHRAVVALVEAAEKAEKAEP